MKTIRIILVLIGAFTIFGCSENNNSSVEKKGVRAVWSQQQAHDWYNNFEWVRGANFNPSSAINQLEIWQKEDFNAEVIDRELGWAEDIGMNSMRVYLHHVAWQQDPEGFKLRMDKYLEIASSHGIITMFVFFDDCWNSTYKAGVQPVPKIGTHNSGWLQDPGKLIYEKPLLVDELEVYVKDILLHFAKDERILLWDVYNEPGNSGYGNKSMPLLKSIFEWGREINPSQPLSAGVWNNTLSELNKFQLENSDVITYHNYEDATKHAAMIDTLKQYGKPLLCTEYMARSRQSTFGDVMPILKENKIGAFNWGLVSGKSNTIYAWDTPIASGEEPEIWFHDIFRKDGSVYSKEEVDLIKTLTGKK